MKDLIKGGVKLLESGERDPAAIQDKFDEITLAINGLVDDFYDNGSETDTVFRDSVGQTVIDIVAHFDIAADVEDLLEQREW